MAKDRHTLIYVRGPLGGPSLPLERVLSRDARGRLPYARGVRLFRDGQPRGAWRLPRDAWMPGRDVQRPSYDVQQLSST